jgi:hypothetical protein
MTMMTHVSDIILTYSLKPTIIDIDMTFVLLLLYDDCVKQLLSMMTQPDIFYFISDIDQRSYYNAIVWHCSFW